MTQDPAAIAAQLTPWTTCALRRIDAAGSRPMKCNPGAPILRLGLVHEVVPGLYKLTRLGELVVREIR